MPPISLALDATDCYNTLKQGNPGLLIYRCIYIYVHIYIYIYIYIHTPTTVAASQKLMPGGSSSGPRTRAIHIYIYMVYAYVCVYIHVYIYTQRYMQYTFVSLCGVNLMVHQHPIGQEKWQIMPDDMSVLLHSKQHNLWNSKTVCRSIVFLFQTMTAQGLPMAAVE